MEIPDAASGGLGAGGRHAMCGKRPAVSQNLAQEWGAILWRGAQRQMCCDRQTGMHFHDLLDLS